MTRPRTAIEENEFVWEMIFSFIITIINLFNGSKFGYIFRLARL